MLVRRHLGPAGERMATGRRDPPRAPTLGLGRRTAGRRNRSPIQRLRADPMHPDDPVQGPMPVRLPPGYLIECTCPECGDELVPVTVGTSNGYVVNAIARCSHCALEFQLQVRLSCLTTYPAKSRARRGKRVGV